MKKFLSWLYLPEAYTPIISRMVGLLSLPIAVVIWFWTHAGVPGDLYPQPFNVPAWRIGHVIFDLPLPPEPLNYIIFGLFAVAALLLVAGQKFRILYIYMAAVLAYYASREWFVCCFFWVLLDFLFLVALSTRAGSSKDTSDQASPCRRLIQLALATCYLYSVLQKYLYPDFWLGISLESYFHDGFAVTPFFRDFVVQHPLPMSAWQACAVLVTVGEALIALGLFFKKTRLAACLLGLILHGGIIVLMDPIITIFSLEMWSAYLAFFDKKSAAVDSAKASDATGGAQCAAAHPLKTAFSVAFIALMLLMPARIYWQAGPPNDLLTLFDRTPWTFGMFLMRQKVDNLEIAYDDAAGQTHEMPVSGRMKTISNDNELIALARYVRQKNPQAAAIRINDQIIVNERRRILKTLIWNTPSKAGSWPEIAVASAGDYCRGAANRNPDSDRHP
ncbi:MAG: hypothetical protein KGS72_08215 [Cyanobacteria bacterium REEB67]|nr:hypothetical protein [Cyanobacteria bacterium REEB67]